MWLFGSRANNSYRQDSDWDLLVFADLAIFTALKESTMFYEEGIDLLVVFNAADFENPWPDNKGTKKGTLTNWEWTELSLNEATYKSVKWFKDNMLECKTLKAVKIWPIE